MTTWAATGYVPRLLEIAGLADVVVYVASDERYNDEVPTRQLDELRKCIPDRLERRIVRDAIHHLEGDVRVERDVTRNLVLGERIDDVAVQQECNLFCGSHCSDEIDETGEPFAAIEYLEIVGRRFLAAHVNVGNRIQLCIGR